MAPDSRVHEEITSRKVKGWERMNAVGAEQVQRQYWMVLPHYVLLEAYALKWRQQACD
jgi:hypothetical protein